MAKVFVSYSRKDIEFAKRLTAELQKSDLDFWIDWEGIPPTVDWWREIEKGIEEADVFLFLISSDSSASKVCGKEIDCAVKNAKRIIPLVVRDFKGDEAPKQLSHLNWIFFREQDDFNTAFQKLSTAIHTDYEWVQHHRWLQVRALDWVRDNKDNSSLLRGKDLQDVEFQLATNSSKEPHPTDLQREYVFESRESTDRQRRRTTSIAIGGAAILALLAVVAVVMAVRATRQSKISRTGELAAQSVSLRDSNFRLSLLLSIESFHNLPDAQSQTVLFDNIRAHPRLISYFHQLYGGVSSVAFSPDGKSLIVVSGDGRRLMFDLATHQKDSESHVGKANTDFDNVYSPDGKTRASVGENNTIILWDLSNDKPIGQPLAGHTKKVTSVAFSPNGKILASSSADNSIILWDVTTQKSIDQLIGHTEPISSLAFSPDGKILASGSCGKRNELYFCGQGDVILWNIVTENAISRTLAAQTKETYHAIAFSPDGKIFASGNDAGTIILEDIGTGQSIGKPLTGSAESVTSAAFSPNGKFLASGGNDGNIILWDVETGHSIGQQLQTQSRDVWSLAFSPDGKTLASGSQDGSIILWDVSTGKSVKQTFTGYTNTVYSLDFSPNGKILASGGAANPFVNPLVLWDVATGKPLKQSFTEYSNSVISVAFSPDGKILASGGGDGSIILWDVQTGKSISKPVTGHTDWTFKITFRPDGKTVASGSTDRTIALWDVETGKPIGQPLVASGSVVDLAFSPDGKTLLSGSINGDVNLWDVDTESWITKLCQRAGRNFTRAEWEQYGFTEPYRKTCKQWLLE